MTVMVTGASGMIGRELVPLLAAHDEVRAAVRDAAAAASLREMGAKVTVGRLDDAGALTEVCWGVETLLHLAGGPNHPDEAALLEANHATTLRALEAATAAKVRRFVLVSVPGADPDASDPFLRAKGLAEEAVAASGLEFAVIRCTHVYGIGSLWLSAVVEGAVASPPFVLGGEATASVSAREVARVLVAADDRDEPLAGTWALEGPEPIEPEALYRLLAGADAPEPARPDAEELRSKLTELLELPVAASAVRHLRSGARADAPDAAGAFGVTPGPFEDGLRRVLAHAAATAARPDADRRGQEDTGSRKE